MENELDEYGTPTFTSKSESKVSNNRDITYIEKRTLKNIGDLCNNYSIPEEFGSPRSFCKEIVELESEKSNSKSIHLQSNDKLNE